MRIGNQGICLHSAGIISRTMSREVTQRAGLIAGFRLGTFAMEDLPHPEGTRLNIGTGNGYAAERIPSASSHRTAETKLARNSREKDRHHQIGAKAAGEAWDHTVTNADTPDKQKISMGAAQLLDIFLELMVGYGRNLENASPKDALECGKLGSQLLGCSETGER